MHSHIIFEKERRRSLIVTGLVAAVALAATVVFLIPAGFAHGNREKYADMQNGNKKQTETTDPAKEEEAGSVVSLTYGMGDDFDIQSGTVDLSSYAKRKFPEKMFMKFRFKFDLDAVPLSGKIWMPKDSSACPVMFIIHGNHGLDAESYLGYGFLGEYLARNGYVVISVDENSCNCLSNENDGRAVLLLENIRQVLAWNADEKSVLYQSIDSERIALAGHARGGEAVSIATLFNRYKRYPENANIRFDYGFSI